MNTRINKHKSIAVVGCGYWGTIIVNNLTKIGYKKVHVYDSNPNNSKTLKSKFINVIIEKTKTKKNLNCCLIFIKLNFLIFGSGDKNVVKIPINIKEAIKIYTICHTSGL